MKPLKNAVIRARCHETLKKDVEDIARLQSIDPADVVRKACQNYVRKVRESMNQLAMVE